jgi:cytochrome c5
LTLWEIGEPFALAVEAAGRVDRSRVLAWCGVVAGAALLGACGGPSPEEVAQGRTVFQKTCAVCHGADAHGMPKLGKDLHSNEFVRRRSDAEIVQFLKKGRPAGDPLNEGKIDMPPKGGNPALTDDDLRLIVVFLRTLQG